MESNKTVNKMNKEQIELFLSEINVLLKHGAKLPNISEEDEVCIVAFLSEKSWQDALHFVSRYNKSQSLLHAIKRFAILEFRGHKLPDNVSSQVRRVANNRRLFYTSLTDGQIASLLSNQKGFSKPAEHILVDSITEMSFQDAFLITKRLGFRTETLFEMANTALEFEYTEWIKKTE